MSVLRIVVPGQDLGTTSKFIPGPGTHLFHSHIYASIAGYLSTSEESAPTGPPKRLTKITAPPQASLPTLSVSCSSPALNKPASHQNGAHAIKTAEIVPEVNSTVLCKITRIMPRQATAAILVVGETVLDGEWQGIIRVQDVRATEKDRVKIAESFRPGDVVRATVISLGDQSSYYLSTANNRLGVIMATSEAGNAMYPISWKEYRDPQTGTSENRKVAKPT